MPTGTDERIEARRPSAEDREPISGSYFVSTYPPFSTWDGDGAKAFRQRLERRPTGGTPLGLYVHIPFCVDRCRYCYYLSHDDRAASTGSYLAGLERELALYRDRPALSGRQLSYLYVGGGTPSTLPPKDLARMLRYMRRFLPWEAAAEVTVECAPKTVTREKLAVLHDGGVTRISLGVQQLDDEVLRRNGRVHLVRDVERAWDEIRSFPFEVVNVDLMVGMLGETDLTFLRSIEQVIAMKPECVTLYLMEVPHNTPLYLDLRAGTLDAPLPSWRVKRARMRDGFARLQEAGYHVRSAYALVRDPLRHRFVYQDAQYRGADLLGVGASSFSYLDGVHHQNLASLDSWQQAISRGDLPLWRGRALSAEERMRRELMLRLKLGELPRAAFRVQYGVDPAERFRDLFDELAGRGWVTVLPEAIRLTRQGLLHVDRMLTSFYLPEHRGLRYS